MIQILLLLLLLMMMMMMMMMMTILTMMRMIHRGIVGAFRESCWRIMLDRCQDIQQMCPLLDSSLTGPVFLGISSNSGRSRRVGLFWIYLYHGDFQV